jgi:phytanoyl-CoA hydroxylase
MSNSSYLTGDQVEFFHEQGYLVINDFWTTETVARLRNKIDIILRDLAPADNLDRVQSVFNTLEQERKTDEYFLSSGDKIRFFWEAGAKDANGNLVQSAEECVNKIGHALHDLDPDFQQVSYEERVGKICRELGLVKPLAVQSMYIFKQANIGGEVCPHQDGAFLYTEPQSVIGFWWPLDDCLQSNGCLWAVPGSHNLGVTRRFKRKDPPLEGTEFVPKEPVVWDLQGAVPLETPAGSLVLLHHSLVHYSSANTSPKVGEITKSFDF